MRGLRSIASIALAAVGTFACGPCANATTFVQERFKCPIGGKRFVAGVVASSTSWGQRPDGRQYGTLPIFPITECPDNGFLLFKEKFEPQEIAVLTPLVVSTEYQAIRQTETPYYRAWWLQTKVQASPYDLAASLMQAAWETDDNPERKVRYAKLFVAATDTLVRDTEHKSSWFWLNLRAANARRELRDFSGAMAALDRIDKPELLPEAEDQRHGLASFMDGLRTLASEGNSASEPANLIPLDVAIHRCSESGLSASEARVCNSPELAARRSEIQKNMAEMNEPFVEATSDNSAAKAAEFAYEAAKAAAQAASKAKSKPRR